MMKVLYVLRMLVYVVVLSSAMLGALYGLPATARYRVVEQYQFAATAESGDIALGVLAPRSGPYQRVSAVDVVWNGEISRERVPGLEILMLSGPLPAGEIRTATVAYEAVLPQGKTLWDAPVHDLHLSPQEKIESDAAPIAQLATLLSAHNAATRRDVFAIYSFVAGYLTWPTEDRVNVTPTAMDALMSRVGVCEDFANLMVALCRATGAPAQVISGLYFPETLRVKSKDNKS